MCPPLLHLPSGEFALSFAKSLFIVRPIPTVAAPFACSNRPFKTDNPPFRQLPTTFDTDCEKSSVQ